MDKSHYIFMMAGKIVGYQNCNSDEEAISIATQLSDMRGGNLIGAYKMIGSSESNIESV